MTGKTSWDLSALFKSDTDPKMALTRKAVEKEVERFVKKWESRNDYLNNPKVLREALDEYELWQKNLGLVASEWYYFDLKSSLDQNNPKLRAKLNKVVEFGRNIQNKIQFFELRIGKIDKILQEKLLTSAELKPYKHFLERLIDTAKYQLSEPEEKIMNLKEAPAHGNWVKMLSSFLAKEEREVLDEKGKKIAKNFSDILSLLNSKNKKVRDSAAIAFNEILTKHLDVAENEINSVLQNKKINDDLRGFERPDAGRHLADDMETKTVDTLVKTISKNFKVAQDYYKLKAKLFGVKKLAYHERSVEYGNIEKKYTFEKGSNLVLKVLGNLDSEFAEIYSRFLANSQIDVYPKKGKRSGAFAAYNLLTQPTYILLNWTNLLDDVRTLAHELGHGINYELVRPKQNALNFGTPISTTEVASTFMEDFVVQELIREASDEEKLSLMMSKLNSDISTIFRQIAFYNFETELHKVFKEKGYLSKEEIGSLFQKYMKSYMGDAVDQSEGSQNWWTYVGHFRYFFYVYSYASGLLISKYLQRQVKKDPKYILKVKEFMSAGLSDSPKNIFKKLGIDITDKEFWESGIDEVKLLLKETKILARKLKKI